MHSEVEKLLVDLRAVVRSDGDVIAAPTDLDLRAASLIDRLYREREKLREALKPFTFDGYSWPHGSHVRIAIELADIEHARSAIAEQPQ
jgi:hypothetical protein